MENKYKHMLSYKQRVADANKTRWDYILKAGFDCLNTFECTTMHHYCGCL